MTVAEKRLARNRLAREQGKRCKYCSCKLTRPRGDGCLRSTDATLDHVIPLDRSGPDTEENSVASCAKCNCLKGNQTADEFLASRGRR
jgi:5-methylcytosine-specific restriction endonuclease McrA